MTSVLGTASGPITAANAWLGADPGALTLRGVLAFTVLVDALTFAPFADFPVVLACAPPAVTRCALVFLGGYLLLRGSKAKLTLPASGSQARYALKDLLVLMDTNLSKRSVLPVVNNLRN